jgi:outer membrane protein
MNVLGNILTVGVLSFFLLTGVSPAADVGKIGVVDFQKILEVSNVCKIAQAEFNRQGKKMEIVLKEKKAEIEDIEKKIDQEPLLINRNAREEKQRELRIKIGDFSALKQKYQDDLKELEDRNIRRVQKEVVEMVQDIGKKEGYTMILEKRAGGVVYMPLAMDITDAVIQIYNARTPKTASKKTLDTVSVDLNRLAIQFENVSHGVMANDELTEN